MQQGRKVVLLGDTCNSCAMLGTANFTNMLQRLAALLATAVLSQKMSSPCGSFEPVHMRPTTGPGAGADVLSHECTFSNEDADKARVAMHSTAAMAGAFAARLQARRLVLTHFSGRYKTTGSARNSAALADESNNTQVRCRHCLPEGGVLG
jgi:hypothetical protein